MIKSNASFMRRIAIKPDTAQAIGWFVLFLACSLLVFVVFSHYYPVLSGREDLIGRIVVILTFLIAALLSRRSPRFQKTMTLASGQRLSSLILQRGNLQIGLTVGLGAFLIVILTAIPVTEWSFNGQNLSDGYLHHIRDILWVINMYCIDR